jgi:uncharacterized membrane protein
LVIDLIKTATDYLATGIEATAGIIIGLAAIEAFVRGLLLFTQPNSLQTQENIRLRLGRWLSLALELELAADILRTAIAPGWDDIGKLAAIVVIRTAINYFLQRDIQKASQQDNVTA